MANTTGNRDDVPDYSLWGDEFNMGAFRANPARWNRDWEKAMRTRPAVDVFTRMEPIYKRGLKNGVKLIPMFTQQLLKMQDVLVKLWEDMDKLGGHFATAWVLLEEKERMRHLNKGFEDSYLRVACRQDARCFAPEITISALLKRNGQGFLEFVDRYVKGKEEAGAGKPYLHPSEWWDKASEGLPETFLKGTDLDEHPVEILTLMRNDFITKYLLYVGMSILSDLSEENAPGMKPVTDLMSADPLIAESLAHTVKSIRDKPIVRCQNCTKTQEENGPNFMLCSICKSKLNFPVHYCSTQCQGEDWRSHKRHCGKQKVAKKLAGTIHDPYWFQPAMPNALRHIPVNSNGIVDASSIGFGDPNRASSYSPALQRQVNLLTADRSADYFLFDERDRPIRFMIGDEMMKSIFRVVRTEVLTSEAPEGVEAMVQYIVKIMGQKPGLSREGIIAQFSKEYRRNVAAELAVFDAYGRSQHGLTLLENMARGMSTLAPLARGQI